MNDFEFSGFAVNSDDTSVSETVSQNSFENFIEDEFYKSHKLLKKTKKTAKKQEKKIKKQFSKYKDLEKQVASLKADVNNLKKSAYNNKLCELVNCDSITERRRLANEICKMEDC